MDNVVFLSYTKETPGMELMPGAVVYVVFCVSVCGYDPKYLLAASLYRYRALHSSTSAAGSSASLLSF